MVDNSPREATRPVQIYPCTADRKAPRRRLVILGGLLAGLMLYGCAGVFGTHSGGKDRRTVFFNSFESPRDTLSWFWRSKPHLTHDTPPGGGNSALRINGGKEMPSGGFITRPVKNGGYYTVQCWAKVLSLGGFIVLSAVKEHQVENAIHLNIVEEDWTLISSSDTLYCPPGLQLMLTLQSGVFLDGAILVDNLVIRRVPKSGSKPSRTGSKRLTRN